MRVNAVKSKKYPYGKFPDRTSRHRDDIADTWDSRWSVACLWFFRRLILTPTFRRKTFVSLNVSYVVVVSHLTVDDVLFLTYSSMNSCWSQEWPPLVNESTRRPLRHPPDHVRSSSYSTFTTWLKTKRSMCDLIDTNLIRRPRSVIHWIATFSFRFRNAKHINLLEMNGT